MFPYNAFREQIPVNDQNTIASVITETEADKNTVLNLLQDPKCRDKILDSQKLFAYVVDGENTLVKIGLKLYFYVIIRNILLDYGITNIHITDYVVELLYYYKTKTIEASYLFEMIEKEMEASTDFQKFATAMEKADSLLILTGIFPQFVEHRKNRRGAPGIEFYEQTGAETYLQLAENEYAHKHKMTQNFELIGTNFRKVRRSLNCVL